MTVGEYTEGLRTVGNIIGCILISKVCIICKNENEETYGQIKVKNINIFTIEIK